MPKVHWTKFKENYSIHTLIGRGAYGCVYAAEDKTNNFDQVAMKHIRFDVRNMASHITGATEVKRVIRELVLHKLVNQMFPDSLVCMRNVVNVSQSSCIERQDIFFVMDKYDMDLSSYLRSTSIPISISVERTLMHKLFLDVSNIHSINIVHRDLKPSNILLRKNQDDAWSSVLCDMGMSRQMSDDARDTILWTDYVTTRWYRSPELCDQFVRGSYSKACDVWSIGCIVYNFITRKTLFPGTSEDDQLMRIVDVIGMPPPSFFDQYACVDKEKVVPLIARLQHRVRGRAINDGAKTPIMGSVLDLVFADKVKAEWKETKYGQDALDILRSIFVWDPNERPTAESVLHHPFFEQVSGSDNLTTHTPATILMTKDLKMLMMYEEMYLKRAVACKLLFDATTTNNSPFMRGLDMMEGGGGIQ